MTDAMLGVIGTITGTIVGLVGGSAITWWGSVDLARRQVFNVVSARLVSAFNDEIAWINSDNVTAEEGGVYKVLCSAFKKHNAAVTEFKFFLKKKDITGFNQAWETYHKHSANFSEKWPDYKKINHLSEYLSLNAEEEQKARALALQRINQLLSYANLH